MKWMVILSVTLALTIGNTAWSRESTPPTDSDDAIMAKLSNLLANGREMDLYKPSKSDAVIALGLLGDDRAVPVLVDHLQNEENDHLRMEIIKALGWIGSTNAVPALEAALHDNYPFGRETAAMALKQITGKEYEFNRTGLGTVGTSSNDLEKIRADVNVLRKQLGLREAVLTDKTSILLAKPAREWFKAVAELKEVDAKIAECETMAPAERIAKYSTALTNQTDLSTNRIEIISRVVLLRLKNDRSLKQGKVNYFEKLLGTAPDANLNKQTLYELEQLEYKLTFTKNEIEVFGIGNQKKLENKTTEEKPAALDTNAAGSQATVHFSYNKDAMLAKLAKIVTYGREMDVYKPGKLDAVKALGLLGDDRAVFLLNDHLENEESDQLRMEITKALGLIGSTNAVPALQAALHDKYPYARSSAAAALKEITGKQYDFDRTGLAQIGPSTNDIEKIRADVNVLRKELGLREAVLTDNTSILLAAPALQWSKATTELKEAKTKLTEAEGMGPSERIAKYRPTATNQVELSEDKIKEISEGILTEFKADCEARQARLHALENMIGEMTPEKLDKDKLEALKQLESKLSFAKWQVDAHRARTQSDDASKKTEKTPDAQSR